MRVLVTGADGFVGKYVIKRLKEAGVEVLALSRGKRENNIEFSLGSWSGFETIIGILKNLDAIVHLAANQDMDLWNKNIITDNVLGMQQMLYIASLSGCKSFIYMSSIGVYGIPKNYPIDENHPLLCQSLYHYTKHWGEELMEFFCKSRSGINGISFRLSSPLGVGMRKDRFVSVMIDKFRKHEQVKLYGEGRRVQNYIDVRDVASAVVHALEANKSGVYNLGGSKSYSNFEVAKIVEHCYGREGDIIFEGEDQHDDENWDLNITKLDEDFGFCPHFELPETIEWMINHEVGDIQ